jgi:hypothetical protein
VIGRCRECAHWVFWDEMSWNGQKQGEGRGTCHRRAPVAIPVVKGQAETYTAWPLTSGGDGCGEFETSAGDLTNAVVIR